MKRSFVSKSQNYGEPASSSPVCVTGATGYIAMHLVEQLLARGYRVRGTVRSTTSDKAELLREFDGASERLELIEANLLENGAFDKAVDGCDFVMHTASPFFIEVQDPYKDLINPALKGTENVLNACANANVKKVVLTSSVAAVNDVPDPQRIFSEDDWNEGSTATSDPYPFSKTVAEKKAWEIQKEHPSMELVTINPGLVIGPSHVSRFSQSLEAIKIVLEGKEIPAIINIGWSIVDVRDVARAHILAMENSKANGRYICTNESLNMRELADKLRRYFPRYNIPSFGMDGGFGSSLVRMGSYLLGAKGQYVRSVVGLGAPQYDTGKIQQELGMNFSPIDTTLSETVDYLVESGQIPDFRG